LKSFTIDLGQRFGAFGNMTRDRLELPHAIGPESLAQRVDQRRITFDIIVILRCPRVTRAAKDAGVWTVALRGSLRSHLRVTVNT
jgi:hypothetical protein